MGEIKRSHIYSPAELSPEVKKFARLMYPPEVLTSLVAIRFASEIISGLSNKKVLPMQISDLDELPREELLRIGAAAIEYLEDRARNRQFYDNHIMIVGPWPGTGKTTVAKRLISEFQDIPALHLNTFELFDQTHTEIGTPANVFAPPVHTQDISAFVTSKLNETLSVLYRLKLRPNNEHIFIGGIIQRLGALAAYLGLFDRDENGKIIIPKHWEKLQLISSIEPYAIVFVDSPFEHCITRARNQAIDAIRQRNPDHGPQYSEQEIQQEYPWAKRAAAFQYAATIREYTLGIMEKMRDYSQMCLNTPLLLCSFLNYDIEENSDYYASTIFHLMRKTYVYETMPELVRVLRENNNPTKFNMWFDRQEQLVTGGRPLVPVIVDRRRNHPNSWLSSGEPQSLTKLMNLLHIWF